MPRQKVKELHYSCKLVARCIFIQYNSVHYIYGSSQPCLTLSTSCILIACNNYITTKINLVINQRLLCNKCMNLNNTYDHATCIHFHHSIHMTFQLGCN